MEMLQLARKAEASDTEISVIRGAYGTVPGPMMVGSVITTLATPVYQNEDLSAGLPPHSTVFWPVSQWWIGLLIGVVVGYLIRLVS